MFHLAHLTDYGLLFLRVMAGATYANKADARHLNPYAVAWAEQL